LRSFGDTLNLLYGHHNLPIFFEQVDWAIYYRIFLKDKHKGLAFKKILEDATLFLNGPSQISYNEESLSESLELADSEEQFDDSVDLGDSDSDSNSE
jgi:hypothetical protein